jgi:hypothetical protein
VHQATLQRLGSVVFCPDRKDSSQLAAFVANVQEMIATESPRSLFNSTPSKVQSQLPAQATKPSLTLNKLSAQRTAASTSTKGKASAASGQGHSKHGQHVGNGQQVGSNLSPS